MVDTRTTTVLDRSFTGANEAIGIVAQFCIHWMSRECFEDRQQCYLAHFAARCNRVDVLRALIDTGACMFVRKANLRYAGIFVRNATPLEVAAAYGCVDAARFLARYEIGSRIEDSGNSIAKAIAIAATCEPPMPDATGWDDRVAKVVLGLIAEMYYGYDSQGRNEIYEYLIRIFRRPPFDMVRRVAPAVSDVLNVAQCHVFDERGYRI